MKQLLNSFIIIIIIIIIIITIIIIIFNLDKSYRKEENKKGRKSERLEFPETFNISYIDI